MRPSRSCILAFTVQPIHRVDKYIELAEWLAFDCENPELGLEWIDRAIAEEPENAEALAVKGDILQAVEQFDGALICYEKVLELVPDAVEAIAERAQALCGLGRWAEAVAAVNEGFLAVEKRREGVSAEFWQPVEESLYDAKAHALFEMGQKQESLRTLEEGLARYPESEALRVPLQQIHNSIKQDEPDHE